MRKSFALICALTMTCLTGLAHATHLKGGSVTWKRDTTAPDFTVDAEVIVNFDLSSGTDYMKPEIPSESEITMVNGVPFYQVNNEFSASVSLDWGTGGTVNLSRFKVVKVDPAAQIVTAKAIEYGSVSLSKTYTWSGSSPDHYDIRVWAADRDTGEELANRGGKAMQFTSRVTEAAGNSAPAFDPEDSDLVIVNKGSDLNPVVTFHVPTATDPNTGDTVKYSFIENESDSGGMYPDESNIPWEKRESTRMTITDAGLISWDTSEIDQTIKTYCIQVVARDYAPDSTVPKSSTTLEFQVWVNDTEQTGVPEIVVEPATSVVHMRPGVKGGFRVVGFDHGENSRLKLIYNPTELPTGAVMLPTAGFAGEGHHNEGDYLTCAFSWTPPTSIAVGYEKTMHFKFEDEDGLQSDEVAVTVKVVNTPVPTEPVVLTVSQASFENVQQGALVSFTATGTCAATGVSLSLASYSDLPDGASFSPVLPAHGGNSVTSTFTWQTDSGDFTLPEHPIKIEVILADADDRREVRTVTISMGNQPPPPVVALAAGTTVPIPATAWQNLVVNFTASGGTPEHHELLAFTENAGEVEELYMHSPGSGRVVWRVVPGQIQNGMLRIRVVDEWGGSTVLQVPIALANPGAPSWWNPAGTANDVLTGGAAVDFAMANHGQLKAIATRAYAQLAAEFPDIATATPEGELLAGYVAGFNASSGNYEPLLQGELKHATKLFYDAIGAATGKGNIGYPWGKDSGIDRHNSPATVGQVKMAFSFPQPLGGAIFNEPPSSVVITSPTQGQHFYVSAEKDITVQVAASDPDGDIERVEFYENGVLFATDTTAPYEAVFEDAPFGTYALTAKAIDSRDQELTSSAVSVTVASTGPSSVSLVGLTEGAHYPGWTGVPIRVDVSDPDDNIVRVDIWKTSGSFGTSIVAIYLPPSVPPYEATWVDGQDTYEIWAIAYDADGQTLESEHIHVVRD